MGSPLEQEDIFVGYSRVVKSQQSLCWRIMDLRQVVATNLRRMRRAKNLSQEELAWDAGVNRSHMAVIETGKSWVRLDIIEKLA
jgi:DNA-binding XRE family transcriptional regulator